MAWVLDCAPDLRPQHVSTLLALANQSRPDGTGAWPSVATIARQVRKSERQVQSDLRALEAQGLIRRGDQQMVLHLPSGRRPVVYDLAMPACEAGVKSASGVKPTSPEGRSEAREGVKPTSARGEADFTQPVRDPVDNPEDLSPVAAPPRPEVERLCAHLADRIEINKCKRPNITQRWRDAARLMLDADGRTEEQVMKCIDWCQNDEFWRVNILSMPKLREKFDQLRLAAAREQNRRRAGSPVSRRQADIDALFAEAAERMGVTT
jgi:predicted transcriptional regulator